MSKYQAVVYKEEGIWTAYCPSVAGCYGLGKTPRSAMADLRSAMTDMIAYLKSIGESQPGDHKIALMTVEI